MKQVHCQIRIKDREVDHWHAVAARLIPAIEAEITKKGEPEYPPEMPPLKDGLQGFIHKQFRVLMAWVPDWSPNRDAGHHVIRFDTMIRER